MLVPTGYQFLCVPHIGSLDTHQGLLHLVVNTSLHRVNDVFAGLHGPLYLASVWKNAVLDRTEQSEHVAYDGDKNV